MASEIQAPPGESEEASPQRGATRAPIRKPVRLRFDDAIDDLVEGTCHDVSIGGMFVHSSEGRQVGSLVRFELLLGEESSIRGLAEVVWMRAQDHGPERVAGMGLKFRFLEQRDRQLIFKLVSQHIKERLAARHPGLGDSQQDADEISEPEAPPIRAPASTMERITTPVGAASASAASGAELLPSIDGSLDDLRDEPRDRQIPDEPAPAAGAPAAGDDESGQRSLLFGSGSQERTAADAPVAGYDAQTTHVEPAGHEAEPTGAWLQQGLEPDSFEASAGFGADEASHAAGHEASDEAYESDLYGDDTHFEHRPKPRRDVPVLTLAAVLVTALAVSAYLWGDRIFERGLDEEDVAPAPLTDTSARSDPASEETGAATPVETAGEPPASAGAENQPEPQEPAEPEARRDSPPPSQTAPPPSVQTPAARPFRAVRDISARVAGAEVEIVITTDGRVESERFSHARLPSGAPRELIRLRGLGERFATERIPVGIGAVRQVRTGWHRKPAGNELHVVIDLADGAARLTGIRVEGDQIIASIKG